MSAIAGAVFTDERILSDGLLRRLAAAGAPRGFDGVGLWRSGPAGLVRHHHATTPEAIGETQPLVGRDGRTVVVFDGRLDNRPDLLTLLGGRAAGSTPDCAILLALFERFGTECVQQLVGDWAFALWQPAEHRLFCARSPMGWRPLLWSLADDCFAFATEPRALLAGLGLKRTLDEGMVGEVLAGQVVTRTATLWAGISQLEQGAALSFADGRLRHWRWHESEFADDTALSDADHIDRFNNLFSRAVIATTRSATSISAQLSGGLDSSSVVVRATELHRAGLIDRPIQAISARFPGCDQDESQWSRAVEEKLGIVARVTAALPYSFAEAERWCADTLQLPVRPNVFDTSVAAYRLLEREGGRVLLTGEGGDDWMNGGVAYFADLLRQGRWSQIVRDGIANFPADPVWRRLARVGRYAVAPHVSASYRQRLALPHLQLGGLPPRIRADWAARIGLADRIRQVSPSRTFARFAQQQRYANFDMARRTIGYDNVVALAEHHGVELRHPFHDLRLTHFFMSAAPRMLRRGLEKKIVLREAMRGSLPELVRTRQDKTSFIDSIAAAVSTRIADRPIERMLPVRYGWLDGDVLRTMADGLAERDDSGRPAAALGPLWYAVAIDLWLQHAVGE